MSKKKRVESFNFQKAVIERLILQKWKNSDLEPDNILDDVFDSIDPKYSLSSNIATIEHGGFFHPPDEEEDEEERKREEEYAIKELESQFLCSLTPVYLCIGCEEESKGTRVFRDKIELIKHFWKEHGQVIAFPPKEPYNFEYIILKALVDKYVEIHKKYVSSKYFTMTCAGLYDILLFTLGLNKGDEYAPSNQTPTHVLRHLGLLNKNSNREKNRKDRDKKGNRIYHINFDDLEQAVSKTEFHDLKLIFGQIDINAVIQSVVKPSSPTKDEDEEEESIFDVTAGGTGGLDDEWEV